MTNRTTFACSSIQVIQNILWIIKLLEYADDTSIRRGREWISCLWEVINPSQVYNMFKCYLFATTECISESHSTKYLTINIGLIPLLVVKSNQNNCIRDKTH